MLHKNTKLITMVCYILTSIFSFVSFSLLNSHPVSAATLSITISTDTLSTNVVSPNAYGTFATSNAADISISTNQFTGYTLGIKAATSDQNATNLINTTDNTKVINSISSTLSESDFSASSNVQYNNQWGYKPSKFNSSANTTNYYPSPTVTGDTLDVTNASNSTANTYTISFGTRINSDVTPGTYTNTYVITAVTNPIPYSITYNKNTTDNVTSMPTPNPATGGTYDDHINLSSTVPVRSGYKFVSWCSSNASETNCSGTSYQPSGVFAINQSSNEGNTATLYAIWVKEAKLDTGQRVNRKLKRLAGNSSAGPFTEDNNITALIRSDTLPNGFTPSTENTISADTSTTPIYAWYDSESTTIYYYSEATNILANENSGDFFYEMRAISNLSTISTWDTSGVMDMNDMFRYTGYNATAFTLDLSSWKTSTVTNLENMFSYAGYNATTFTLDLSSWNTSNVTSVVGMFSYAGRNAATWSIGDLSSWNTSSVTNMPSMFNSAGYNSTTFTLDLSSWNTSNATNIENMFSSAGNNATTWAITIPKTNNGTATGPISNTTSNLYGNTASVTATPPYGKLFTIAN